MFEWKPSRLFSPQIAGYVYVHLPESKDCRQACPLSDVLWETRYFIAEIFIGNYFPQLRSASKWKRLTVGLGCTCRRNAVFPAWFPPVLPS